MTSTTSLRRHLGRTAIRIAVGVVLTLVMTACASTAVGSGNGDDPTATPSPTATPMPTPTTSDGAGDPHQDALDALALARADWAAQGLSSYTFVLTRQCFCPPEATGPWTVQVTDGAVTSVTAEDGSDVALTGGFFDFGTVESLHDVIEGMLAEPEATTPSGTYDAQGLPQALYVDPSPMMADEEATFTAVLAESV